MKWTDEQKAAAKARYANKKEEEKSIQKIEDFNGEVIPEPEEREGSIGFSMTKEDKLQSILNTVKILPPNLMKDKRHQKTNIQALNCFIVTDEMIDEVYKNFAHEPF